MRLSVVFRPCCNLFWSFGSHFQTKQSPIMRSNNYLLTPTASIFFGGFFCELQRFTCAAVFAVCFLHQTQPVKLRGALTGVWLGAKNEEEMNYMAPSHSPADSISAESQQHGRVCERSAHKYPPPPPPPPPHTNPKGASLMVMAKGCRCLGDWVLLVLALGTSLRSEPEWGGLPLSVGLKGLAWRRAAAQQQDVPSPSVFLTREHQLSSAAFFSRPY